ncbi:MAG: PAS domain S-box protein, partial [Steroidobacteraceae bacterium]|nr:PAS domain S-box protein [Steroidobacteraceae bacterium]
MRWLNAAAAAELGLADARLARGRLWTHLMPQYAAWLPRFQAALRGQVGADLPPRVQRAGDGTLRYKAIRLQPLGAYLLVCEQDVTRWAQASSDAPQRLARLRALTQGRSDLVFVFDGNGNVLCNSPSVERSLGYRRGELEGRNLLEFIHPDDLPLTRARLRSGAVVSRPRPPHEITTRVRARDGGWRWLRALVINAIADPHLGAVIAYCRDATRRVERDRVLRQRERRLSALTEHSDDMIVVLTLDGRFSFESASVGRILGYRPRELTALRVLRLVHRKHRRAVMSTLRSLLVAADGPRRFDCLVRAFEGGYRWIEAVVVNLTSDPDVAGIVINARDVTARKDAELERDTALSCAQIGLWEQDVFSRQIRWITRGAPKQMALSTRTVHSEADFYEQVHPDDRAAVAEAYRQLECGLRGEVAVEYRARAIDGGWCWILERARLAGVHSRTGQQRIAGVCIDVTAQRAAEQLLAQTRAAFTAAMEAARIVYYERDLVTDTATGLDEWCASRHLSAQSLPGARARWRSYI